MSEQSHLPESQNQNNYAAQALDIISRYDFDQAPKQGLNIKLAPHGYLIEDAYLPKDSDIDVFNASEIYKGLSKAYPVVPLMRYVTWDQKLYNFAVAWKDDGTALFTTETRYKGDSKNENRPVNTMNISLLPNQNVMKMVAAQHGLRTDDAQVIKGFDRMFLHTVHEVADKYTLDAIAGKHGFNRVPRTKKGIRGVLGRIATS